MTKKELFDSVFNLTQQELDLKLDLKQVLDDATETLGKDEIKEVKELAVKMAKDKFESESEKIARLEALREELGV